MTKRRWLASLLTLCLLLTALVPIPAQAASPVSWEWNTPGNQLGWYRNDQIDAYCVTSGWYVLHIPGRNDPNLTSSTISLDTSVYKILRISYYNATGNANGKLYWHNAGEGFSEAKSMAFTTKTDGSLHTIELDLSQSPNWKGVVTQLRFDPTEGGNGNFGVDSLTFLTEPMDMTEPADSPAMASTPHLWHWNQADNALGWERNNHIDAHSVEDGWYTLHIIGGNDPYITSPNLTIDADKYDTLRITYRNTTGNTNGALYWHAPGEGFSQANSIGFTTIADGKTHTLEVDLSSQANWHGSVARVRFDPVDGGVGSFSLGSLAFVSSEPEVTEPETTEPETIEPEPTEPAPTEPVEVPTQTGAGSMPIQWLWQSAGDTMGWSHNNNIDNYCVADGRYILHIPGKNDPFIMKGGLHVDTSVYKYFEITYRNDTGNTHGRLYWARTGEGHSEACSTSVETIADGAWHTLRIDLSDVPNWSGIVHNIRFDPTNGGTGNFEIDAISVLDKPGRYDLSNGYFSLSGTTGLVDSLRFDPTGKGNYSEDLISGYLFLSLDVNGCSYSSTSHDAKWTIEGSTLTIRDIRFDNSGITGTWVIALDGPQMRNSFTLTAKGNTTLTNTAYVMDILWENNGYTVEASPAGSLKVPFSKMVSSEDRYHAAYAFKRMPSREDAEALGLNGEWMDWEGANGFDFNLRFTPDTEFVSPVCSLDSLRYLFRQADKETLNLAAGESFTRTLTIDLSANSDITPEHFAKFSGSNDVVTEALNDMFYEFGYARESACTGPDWWEWISLTHAWHEDEYLVDEMEHVTGVDQNPDGYVWTWNGLEGWPFPEHRDSNHYITTSANLINAVYNYFMYTGDLEFLETNIDKMRLAMDFLMTMYDAESQIFVITQKDHDGTTNSVGSNYWDIIPYGYKSAYDNIYAYVALVRLAEIEAMLGSTARAEELEGYAAALKEGYNRAFWNSNHYIQTIDVHGVAHDYGAVYLNLEAIHYGLASDMQAHTIMNWLSTTKTSSGKADVFTAFAFAPRAVMFNNVSKSQGGWYVESYDGNGIYGTYQLQNGGADFYTMYYELLCRLKTYGADDAYSRLVGLVNRFNIEHMQGGNNLYCGEKNQHPTEGNVGIWGEFPESGLVPVAVKDGFMGIQADSAGLHVQPNLPSTGMTELTLSTVDYWGMKLEITVTNRTVRIHALENNSPYTDWQINGQAVSGLFDITVSIEDTGVATLARSVRTYRLP